MKRKFFAFVVLLAATLSLSSCLSSDDDLNVEYTHDTAITAFSLGKLDQWGKTKDGTKDSLYKAVVAGANYKFYIDQATRQIYNADSLPCGVRDSAMLATITSKNSSLIVLQDMDKTDSLITYSSTDSINFSKPRLVRVYNNDYTAYATYTVKVNIHKEEGDVFNWQEKAQQNSVLSQLSRLKMVSLGSNIYVFGKNAEGLKIYKTANTDGMGWQKVTANVAFGADDCQNVVAMGNSLYILSAGKIYASVDGSNWQEKGSDASLKLMVGASSKNLYAYTAAGISVSKDQGASWTALALDKGMDYLPTNNLSMSAATIRSAKNVEYLMLMGTRDKSYGDSIATIWNHVVDYDADAVDNEWNYFELDSHQPYKMPMMDQVLTCAADTGFVAVGSNGKWYKSKDNGITWKVDSLVTLPAAFTVGGNIGFCRDANNFYWLIRGGNVWKGRFNRDGWRKDQTIFE